MITQIIELRREIEGMEGTIVEIKNDFRKSTIEFTTNTGKELSIISIYNTGKMLLEIKNPEIAGKIGIIKEVEIKKLRTILKILTIEEDILVLSSDQPDSDFQMDNDDLILVKEAGFPVVILGSKLGIMEKMPWDIVKNLKMLDDPKIKARLKAEVPN